MLGSVVAFAVGVAVFAAPPLLGARLHAALDARFGLPVSARAVVVGLYALSVWAVLPAGDLAQSLLDGDGLAGAADSFRRSLWALSTIAVFGAAAAALYAVVRHVDRADAEAARRRERGHRRAPGGADAEAV